MSTENSPLLSNEGACNLHYGQLSETLVADRQVTCVFPIAPHALPPPYTPAFPITPHELPPPYTPERVSIVICEVCGFRIDIAGRLNQSVIKCSNCNEDTPINSAPLGKKYVRCQCNHLLICKSTSQRIICQADNCNRLINLVPVQTAHPSNLPLMCQVSCAYCQNLFIFNTMKLLDSCPYCLKVSSIVESYPINIGKKCAVAAFLMLIIGISLTVYAYFYATDSIAIYILYLGFFIVSISLFAKSIYYFAMKTSK